MCTTYLSSGDPQIVEDVDLYSSNSDATNISSGAIKILR